MAALLAECEECFYENLTLGLVSLLERTPHVQDVQLERRPPCERLLLAAWEQRHGCALPDDLRSFYTAADGFHLTWSYELAGEVAPVGRMHLNGIGELRRVAAAAEAGDGDLPSLLDLELCGVLPGGGAADVAGAAGACVPSFGARCKSFELDPCGGAVKVCLVYSDAAGPEPSIWLLDRCFDWHFLAGSFSQYFRMLLVHLGLPLWQLRFTPAGLTPWAEQVFSQVAPHLMEEPALAADPSPGCDWEAAPPFSPLDPAVFRLPAAPRRRLADRSRPTPPAAAQL